jgi:hypothetical protein
VDKLESLREGSKNVYKMLAFYDKRKKFIEIIVENIYLLSMTVFIFLGHSVEGYIGSYSYKLFASLFMSFGIWTYEIKKQEPKKKLTELLAKFVTVLLAVFIISEISGIVQLSGLNSSVLYPAFTIFIYWLIHRKSKWGSNLYCSSREYLEQKFGRTASIIPSIILFLAVLVPGIFNASTTMFVASLVIGFTLEQIFVILCFKKRRSIKLET